MPEQTPSANSLLICYICNLDWAASGLLWAQKKGLPGTLDCFSDPGFPGAGGRTAAALFRKAASVGSCSCFRGAVGACHPPLLGSLAGPGWTDSLAAIPAERCLQTLSVSEVGAVNFVPVFPGPLPNGARSCLFELLAAFPLN